MPTPSHYDTLGLASTASADEIKAAYRRLARKYHPDVSEEKDAEAQFKKVGQAYDVLSDEKKRRQYDLERGGRGARGAGEYAFDFGNSGFSDLFRRYSEGQQQQRNRHGSLPVRAIDALTGGETEVLLDGERVKIKIPPHTEDEDTLVVTTPKGVRWTITVEIEELSWSKWPGMDDDDDTDNWADEEQVGDLAPGLTRDGIHLRYTAELPAWQLALGGSVEVPTATGRVRMTVPAGFQPGQQLRARGKGWTPSGDLLVTLQAAVPAPTTDAQRKAYETLAKAFGDAKPKPKAKRSTKSA